MDSDTYAVQDIAYPSIYNLIVDPKEEVPELNYLNDTWIDFPLYQVIEDHEASLANDPHYPLVTKPIKHPIASRMGRSQSDKRESLR